MKEYFNNLVLSNVICGGNYAIIYNDKVEIDTFGYKEVLPTFENNNLDTIYDLASLTKVIVTVPIILKLFQENVINPYDLVSDFLPKFKYKNITIYDLLCHTSGLQTDIDFTNLKSKNELIDTIYSLPLSYLPNEDVVYTDVGYILLGFIIEKVYNKSLDKVAYEQVFKPLLMKNTRYLPIDTFKCAATEFVEARGLIKGRVHDEKSALMGGISGHAGVFSTIDDMINFTQMVLNDGSFNNEVFIEKQYIDLLFENLVVDKSNLSRSFCFVKGQGRVAGNLLSDDTISFTGFTGPTMVIDRLNRLAFVLLTNRVHPTRENTLLLDERGKIMNEIIKTYVKKNNFINRRNI